MFCYIECNGGSKAPPLAPKSHANQLGLLIKTANDHFSCDHALVHAQLFATWSLQKTYVFLMYGALVPSGAINVTNLWLQMATLGNMSFHSALSRALLGPLVALLGYQMASDANFWH